MTLTPGTRLGVYEIVSPLGAGGMGEVFRARDTMLNRDVAIKVLPAALAGDVERLARFKREAQVLAALNHPNIAHVYGFESAPLDAGTRADFLAMELVEGEDLAERLQRGAIPVDEALAIARQIAEGLEEAHEKGIVHRDLKPANVKLTPDGKVKVLDFGLAKALGGAASDSSGVGARHASPLLESSPTLTARATQAGMILGTAAYMSPEQARGKTVDKRADIWAPPLSGAPCSAPSLADRTYLKTQFEEVEPRISPDGRWVAYESTESGRREVYVQSFPVPGAKARVSTSGGGKPLWRPDGRAVFFRGADGGLFEADLTLGSGAVGVATAAARRLFTVPGELFATGHRRNYDVSADGQRFLFNLVVRDEMPRGLTVIVGGTPGEGR